MTASATWIVRAVLMVLMSIRMDLGAQREMNAFPHALPLYVGLDGEAEFAWIIAFEVVAD